MGEHYVIDNRKAKELQRTHALRVHILSTIDAMNNDIGPADSEDLERWGFAESHCIEMAEMGLLNRFHLHRDVYGYSTTREAREVMDLNLCEWRD